MPRSLAIVMAIGEELEIGGHNNKLLIDHLEMYNEVLVYKIENTKILIDALENEVKRLERKLKRKARSKRNQKKRIKKQKVSTNCRDFEKRDANLLRECISRKKKNNAIAQEELEETIADLYLTLQIAIEVAREFNIRNSDEKM